MQRTIIVEPPQEETPPDVMDAFGKMPVFRHVPNLKVFIGNQVVRRDERVCLLAGKIFTLPLHLQIALCQCLSGLLAVLAPLVLAGEVSMQAFEFLFRFAIVARVLNHVAVGVSQEGLKTHINAHFFPRCNMVDDAFYLEAQLHIIPISPMHDTNALDLLDGEGGALLFRVANQTQATNATAIGENHVFAIGFKLPAALFILDASSIVLKLWVALLARLVFLAVVVEPLNSKPCPVCTGLPCLGIESRSKGEFFGKDSTSDLQIVFRDTLPIHPQAQTCVADELNDADCFINCCVLFGGTIKLVLVDQHACLLRRLLLNRLLNDFRTDIACCTIERRACPQGGHPLEMRKRFPQIMRRPTFDESCNVRGPGVEIASHEQMNMIGLDCQFDDLPSVLIHYFSNDLFQTVRYRTNQDFPASFGTPDDMVDDQMDGLLFMDVSMFHVDSIRY